MKNISKRKIEIIDFINGSFKEYLYERFDDRSEVNKIISDYIENLLSDKKETITDSCNKKYELMNISADTIPYIGKYNEQGFVSIKDVIDGITGGEPIDVNAKIQIINGFDNLPTTGNENDIVYLVDENVADGFFIKKQNLNFNYFGIAKNNWVRIDYLKNRFVDITWFGADREGVRTFDLIENILNDFENVYIPEGIFKIPYKITVNKNGKLHIFGSGEFIPNLDNPPASGNFSDYDWFDIRNAKLIIDGITFNGKRVMPSAIEGDISGAIIQNCVFKGFYSNTFDVYVVSLYRGGNIVRNCIFEDIYSESGGDDSGVSRAIVVGAFDTVHLDEITTIDSCIFRDIWGYNADCIQTESQDYDGEGLYIRKNTVVKNCIFYRFGKRAIKFSASAGKAINNIIIMTNDDANGSGYQNALTNEYLRGISCFGIDYYIDGNYIYIQGTHISCGIERVEDGSLATIPRNYTITNNNLLYGYNENAFIELFNVTYFNVSNNRLDILSGSDTTTQTLYAISCYTCKNGKISNNYANGGVRDAFIALIRDVARTDNNTELTENIVINGNVLTDTQFNYFVTAEYLKNVIVSGNNFILKANSSKYHNMVSVDDTTDNFDIYVVGNTFITNGASNYVYADSSQNITQAGNSWQSSNVKTADKDYLLIVVDNSFQFQNNEYKIKIVRDTNGDFDFIVGNHSVKSNLSIYYSNNAKGKFLPSGEYADKYLALYGIYCYVNGEKVISSDLYCNQDGTQVEITLDNLKDFPVDSNDNIIQNTKIELIG